MIEPLVLLLAALPTGLPTPAELQEEIVKARMAIRQGTITMRVEGRGVNFFDDSAADFDWEYRFDFDGDRIRFDQVQTRLDGSLVHRWSIVHEPTKFIELYDGIEKHFDPPRVYMGDRNRTGGWSPIFHPRVIGGSTTNVNWLASMTPESYFRRGDNKSEEVWEDTLDGVPVLRLEIDTGLVNDCRVSYYVDPARGYALRRIDTSFKSDNGDEIRAVLDAKYSPWPNAGTWFLSESTLRTDRNSKTVYTETTHITDAKFNLAPEPKRFDISSIRIPTGAKVVSNTRELVWDGVAMVSEVDEPEPRMKSRSRWDWAFQPKVGIAGASCSLAFLLALQYWRRRNAA